MADKYQPGMEDVYQMPRTPKRPPRSPTPPKPARASNPMSSYQDAMGYSRDSQWVSQIPPVSTGVTPIPEPRQLDSRIMGGQSPREYLYGARSGVGVGGGGRNVYRGPVTPAGPEQQSFLNRQEQMQASEAEKRRAALAGAAGQARWAANLGQARWAANQGQAAYENVPITPMYNPLNLYRSVSPAVATQVIKHANSNPAEYIYGNAIRQGYDPAAQMSPEQQREAQYNLGNALLQGGTLAEIPDTRQRRIDAMISSGVDPSYAAQVAVGLGEMDAYNEAFGNSARQAISDPARQARLAVENSDPRAAVQRAGGIDAIRQRNDDYVNTLLYGAPQRQYSMGDMGTRTQFYNDPVERFGENRNAGRFADQFASVAQDGVARLSDLSGRDTDATVEVRPDGTQVVRSNNRVSPGEARAQMMDRVNSTRANREDPFHPLGRRRLLEKSRMQALGIMPPDEAKGAKPGKGSSTPSGPQWSGDKPVGKESPEVRDKTLSAINGSIAALDRGAPPESVQVIMDGLDEAYSGGFISKSDYDKMWDSLKAKMQWKNLKPRYTAGTSVIRPGFKLVEGGDKYVREGDPRYEPNYESF